MESMSNWQPIESAPRDGTVILGWCDHNADPYFLEDSKRLTNYGANADGMAHAKDGVNLVVWADEIHDDEGVIPAWWMVADHLGEITAIAANPTHWMPLPGPPG